MSKGGSSSVVYFVRGIRGATTVTQNDEKLILDATKELLQEIIKKNSIKKENVAAVFFTTTQDLNAAYPAQAARILGWDKVPLFGSVEINKPEGLPFCIRVLILTNTTLNQDEIKHVYLKNAKTLREDLRHF